MTELDPRYAAARRVLLDALTALASHGPAVIVVGAQAVYLRTGEADVAIAPFTTDGDLALDPALLGEEPVLEPAMRGAGFELSQVMGHVEPGIWVKSVDVDGVASLVPVDLIVPTGAVTGSGRRGVRLGTHGKRAARRAVGLEAALVDHSTMTTRMPPTWFDSCKPSPRAISPLALCRCPATRLPASHRVKQRTTSCSFLAAVVAQESRWRRGRCESASPSRVSKRCALPTSQSSFAPWAGSYSDRGKGPVHLAQWLRTGP